VAGSCPEARHHRAKVLGNTKTGLRNQPRHVAQSCHVAAGSAWSGPRDAALPHVFDSSGLPCDAFLQLFSPSWHSFLLNIVHLSVSAIKFLKISKDAV